MTKISEVMITIFTPSIPPSVPRLAIIRWWRGSATNYRRRPKNGKDDDDGDCTASRWWGSTCSTMIETNCRLQAIL